MTNLRIESKNLFTKSDAPLDPLFLKDLDIWIDNKKVDTALIEYLDVIITPGKEDVTANIKFINLDYFIEGNESKLEQQFNLENNSLKSFIKDLKDTKSPLTIIEGIPIHGSTFSNLSKGFDVNSYHSGLIFPVSKITIKLKPHTPLLVEVTYAPSEFCLNLNVDIKSLSL